MARKSLQIVFGSQVHHLDYDPDDLCGTLSLDGQEMMPDCVQIAEGTWSLILDGRSCILNVQGDYPQLSVSSGLQTARVDLKNDLDLLLDKMGIKSGSSSTEFLVKASIPGLVKKVEIGEGDTVQKGSGLFILEAMKMENEIKSPVQGKIRRITVNEGDTVEKNQMLMEIDIQ